MISIDDAVQSILKHSHPRGTVSAALSESRGRVLADDVVSDIDSPPFDKALMDGYALRAADVTHVDCVLNVVEEIVAGSVPSKVVGPHQASRIMTGSPLPDGADTIVVVENTSRGEGNQKVIIHQYPVDANKNILCQGECLRRSQVVLPSGIRLSAGKLGLLAEVGRDPVSVVSNPAVAILSTGNELVSANTVPIAGQIRNSNGPMLRGMVEGLGAVPVELGIGRDDPAELKRLIQEGLKHPVFILSGGVSAGDLDLVPGILRECNVEQVFHKVQLKPGKPLWFGICGKSLVFGLPGNPVSSFVCFRLFVALAIRALQGLNVSGISFDRGRLVGGHTTKGNRTVFFPARFVENGESDAFETSGRMRQIELLPWKGSADLRTLAMADCLAELPAGTNIVDNGSVRFVICRD